MVFYFFIKKAIHEMDLNEFKSFNITGFSMIDYKNLNTLALLTDTLQMNVAFEKLPRVSVILILILIFI